MVEMIESKMGKVFRRLFLQAFEDGTVEERKGIITRARFNRAVSREMHCKNVPRNTDGYWATAQSMGLIRIPRPNTLHNELQTYSKAQVREDIWARDGFIIEQGQELRDMLTAGTSIRISRKAKKRSDLLTIEEML